MKFLILLSAIFCLSAITAAPTKEPTPLAKAAAEYNRKQINEWEKKIPGWDPKASLRSNLLALLSKPFDNNMVPAWNPDISAKENAEKYFALIDVEGLARNKSVVENLGLIVRKYFDKLPIPSLYPKNELEKEIVEKMTALITKVNSDHNITSETLDQAFNTWLNSLADVKVSDPKDFIKSTLDAIFAKIPFPGFSGDKTLDDIVFELIELMFEKIDL
ncbi:uncharacterized protein LOC107363956 [Tetranychus urticae]|uniref:Uncharacterized protein n=1 Tax=Tetranychus urticae TaxID=32264 RepID=T1KHN3_TETUR|nr:uncharacterized protein LOC107363956 [Tetranychus urticae]